MEPHTPTPSDGEVRFANETSKQLVRDAQETIKRTDTSPQRRGAAWWISVAAALIALTVLIVAITYSVIVNDLRNQVNDLTASNKGLQLQLDDSRTETGCRSQKGADLAYARGVLDSKTATYNVDFNGLVQALLAKNDADTATFSTALNNDSVALQQQQAEVDRLANIQKTAVQDCALSPIDVSDSATTSTQP